MSDTQIDARIKAAMVTATAIYSEAYRRGVIAVPTFTRTTDGRSGGTEPDVRAGDGATTKTRAVGNAK